METTHPFAPETCRRECLRFAFMHGKGGKRPGFTDSTGEYRDTRTGWLSICSALRKLKPVRLPPGLARLATRPIRTASPTGEKTIGIDEVAFFAASAGGVPPLATITSTLRLTRSAA